MRTTVTLDDEMLAIAQELTNIDEKSTLIKEAPPRRRFGK
jgi:Arc/MetJ family transcription regulator